MRTGVTTMPSRGQRNACGWHSVTAVPSALVRAYSLRSVCGPTHVKDVLLTVSKLVCGTESDLILSNKKFVSHSTLVIILPFIASLIAITMALSPGSAA